MSPRRRRFFLTLVLLAIPAGAIRPAAAQTTCVTPNCVFDGAPPACAKMAQPRIPTVQLTTSGINNVFVPSNPKIEPGDCIFWQPMTSTHSASGVACTDDPLCGSIAPPACQFDSGNLDSLAADTATCQYDAASFPAGTGTNYYCRIHATPTTGTMRGTLRVTTPIVLLLDKVPGTMSVKLTWSGGGVTGDVTYRVARNTGGDPLMPPGTTTTMTPDAGNTGTVWTDSGDLLNPTTRYYLVRNRQTNE